MKHLHAENNGVPALDETTLNSPINFVNIGSEATIILEYTFDKPLTINETSNEKKYFADTYKRPITANQSNKF